MVVNYQNGKVYKLWSDQSDMLYIGSTTQSLAKRLGEHKSGIKKPRTKTQEEMQGHTNVKIELIETFACYSREELNAREGHYIRLYRAQLLNKGIAGRTPQESRAIYYYENKDKIRKQQIEYREINRDNILEHYARYRETNRDAIRAGDRARYEANKEEIKAKQRIKYAEKKKKFD